MGVIHGVTSLEQYFEKGLDKIQRWHLSKEDESVFQVEAQLEQGVRKEFLSWEAVGMGSVERR